MFANRSTIRTRLKNLFPSLVSFPWKSEKPLKILGFVVAAVVVGQNLWSVPKRQFQDKVVLGSVLKTSSKTDDGPPPVFRVHGGAIFSVNALCSKVMPETFKPRQRIFSGNLMGSVMAPCEAGLIAVESGSSSVCFWLAAHYHP